MRVFFSDILKYTWNPTEDIKCVFQIEVYMYVDLSVLVLYKIACLFKLTATCTCRKMIASLEIKLFMISVLLLVSEKD